MYNNTYFTQVLHLKKNIIIIYSTYVSIFIHVLVFTIKLFMFKFLLHKYVDGFITSESVILNLKWGYFFIKEKEG